jgi:eukaryotic-like serine/threonine-protein kinase
VQTVAESGGVAQTIVPVDAKQERAGQPYLTGDGKYVLFVVMPTASGTEDDSQIVLQPLDGGARKILVKGGQDPRVLPTGQLVYIHGTTLLGVPFDAKRLEVSGGPVPLVEGVSQVPLFGTGHFAVSSNGTLVYRPGTSVGGQTRSLVWVDRAGHEQPISAKPRAYQYARLSPDGTKIAVGSADEENDIWLWDLAKETLTRLTFGPASEIYSPWMPDGKHILFSVGDSAATAVRDIFRKAADGTGPIEALSKNKSGGAPSSISPDGKFVVYRTGLLTEPNDLLLLSLDGSGKSTPLLADPKFHERNGEISPDGRWIAYESDESGPFEVYVRPFPAVDTGRWQISSDGGGFPLWSRSGKELFYVATIGGSVRRLMVVQIQPGQSFTYGKPQTLFDMSAYYASTGRMIDISPDGKRFLMIKPVGIDPTIHPSFVVVSHWVDEVRAKVSPPR